MFSWRCSIHEMAPFGGFLGSFSHKYGSSLLKFRPEVVSHKTKTVSEQSFKIKCLCGNRTYPKKGVLSGLRQFLATESPLKTMKNAFYFTLKALFVLEIFKFLS